MKILLTTLEMEYYGGLPLYTRDMALELKRQGHTPEIYTLNMGKVAQELIDANIHVTNNPAKIKIRPDVIHGQHRVSALIAIKQFRTVPALFICHNHTTWGDEAPFHARILRYLGVSLVCMERLKKDGVPENKIMFLANFVDTNRFKPRSPLPSKPAKALVFSNYATEHTHLPAIREACRQVGLELDVVGLHTNYITTPENVLGNYDIVFAKAKAAIESMATGNAVILCDFSGVGPMVTLAEFDKLRMANFGFQSLTKTLDSANILPEIARYNPDEARKVCDLIRTSANLEQAAKNMLAHYETIIKQYRDAKWKPATKTVHVPFRESFYWERARFWAALTPKQTKLLKRIANTDPAAQELQYIYTRDLILQEEQKGWFKGWFEEQKGWFQAIFVPSVQKQMLRFQNVCIQAVNNTIKTIKNTGTVMQMYVVKMWLTIPQPTRARIKNLPLARTLLGILKRMLRLG